MFAAAATHREGFLAAAAKNSAPAAGSLGEQLLKGLSQEIYALQRRATMVQAPAVTGKEIILKGRVAKGRRDLEGFIAGQGGQEAGYGVYVNGGKLTMALRQAGKTYTATTTRLLPEKFDLEARLLANGDLVLSVDGQEAGRGKASALFAKTLTGPLRVQRDLGDENGTGAYAGAYTNAFEFAGNLGNHRRVNVPDTDALLIDEISHFTKREKIDDPNHVSFLRGAVLGGSHPHLVQEFVAAIVEGRKSAVDADLAANYTCAGI